MTPYYDDGQVRLLQGDVREVLATLEAESVQTCVTSPPYWSLRDYKVPPTIWGGDELHIHDWESAGSREGFTGSKRWQHPTDDGEGRTRENSGEDWGKVQQGESCACGAWRGCLGLEPTPEMFIEHTVMVFREVRRVLRNDGTLWLNIGDSYAGSWGSQGHFRESTTNNKQISRHQILNHPKLARKTGAIPPGSGLKEKDLVGIPWMLAFALRADGWYLRQEIIWHKPNPMPESTKDRCTKAHESIFLLTKRPRYYYDQDAIREPSPDGPVLLGANKRSVWTVPTAPFAEAHFATFPPALIEPCILAGAPEGGVVLDPFVGSGTTAMVARRLGRRAIGIDLSAQYLEMAVRRAGGQLAMIGGVE